MKLNLFKTSLAAVVVWLIAIAALAQDRDTTRSLPSNNSLPDLTVTGYVAADEFTVQTYVKNVGPPVTHAFTIDLYIYGRDNKQLQKLSQISQPLGKGESKLFVFKTSPLSLFGKRFQVFVDPGNRIAESNESNNRTPLKTTSAQPVAPTPGKTEDKPKLNGDLAASDFYVDNVDGKEVGVAVFKNVGSEASSPDRFYSIVRIVKVGSHSITQQVAANKKLRSIAPGDEWSVQLNKLPPKLADAKEYVYRLSIMEGDDNPNNDRFERTIKVKKKENID